MTRNQYQDVSPEEKNYLEWKDTFLSDPKHQALYEEEAAKSELWFHLVEAHSAMMEEKNDQTGQR